MISNHSSLAAEASIYEEPGAGKSHAGICAGAVGQLAVLPRPTCFNVNEMLSFLQKQNDCLLCVSSKRQITVPTAPVSVTGREQRVLLDYLYDFEGSIFNGKLGPGDLDTVA